MSQTSTTNKEDDTNVGAPIDSLFRLAEFGPKGRGLFSATDIPPRTVIHVAPCLPVGREEYENHMRHTILEHYLFNDSGGNKLLALGYGSLFNHSRTPNIDYRIEAGSIVYSSGHRQIPRDEELCISYGGNLWFDDADGLEKSSESSDENDIEGFLGRIELGEEED